MSNICENYRVKWYHTQGQSSKLRKGGERGCRTKEGKRKQGESDPKYRLLRHFRLVLIEKGEKKAVPQKRGGKQGDKEVTGTRGHRPERGGEGGVDYFEKLSPDDGEPASGKHLLGKGRRWPMKNKLRRGAEPCRAGGKNRRGKTGLGGGRNVCHWGET